MPVPPKQLSFFTRSDVKKKGNSKKDEPILSLSKETLHNIGTRISKSINPYAVHPNMEPTGSKNPLLYVLGEAPGADEDDRGVQFVGRSGRLLRNALYSVKKNVCFDNVCRTCPIKEGKGKRFSNRPPTFEEIECFRPVIEAEIKKRKPKVILAVGGLAARWVIGEGHQIKLLRGRKIPVEINGHPCWFCPILHPAYILRLENQRDDKVPGNDWLRVFEEDIQAAIRLACSNKKPKVIKNIVPGENVDLIFGDLNSVNQIKTACSRMKSGNSLIGLDIETSGDLYRGGDILSISFYDGEKNYAVGLKHPQTCWNTDDYKQALKELRSLFLCGKSFVAHNLPFDLEWLIDLFGLEIIDKSVWEDSLQAAYVLDERPGGMSLNFLCLLEFGLPLKKITEEGSRRTELASIDLDRVLKYNALDAEWCFHLFNKLKKRIEKEGIQESYKRQIDRVAPVVLARRVGMPIDQSCVKEFEKQISEDLVSVLKEIHESKEVKKYEKQYGAFTVTSVPNMVVMLRDVLHREEGRQGSRYTTKNEVLEAMREEVPFVDLILKLRSLAKLKSTYVDRFVFGCKDGYVYPDGKLHCNFKISLARARRLSCENPNNQNWPKRKHKEIRKILSAPAGHILIAADYGQVEARVLAMASKDKTWVDMLWDNYDVHLEWAEKIAKRYPPVFKKANKDIKQFRSLVKGKWVFAAFYGSSIESISKNIGVPENIAFNLFDEFWETFAGIKAWQKRMWSFYTQHGYVDGLSGWRRRKPLSFNMVINTPIQSTASDICVDAMTRLSKRARIENKMWLQPPLQIHDDLTFIVPKENEEEAICEIVTEMLSFEAPWLNVPLIVELESGPNLFEMQKVGTFSSDLS